MGFNHPEAGLRDYDAVMRMVVAVVLLIGCGSTAPAARTAAESAAPEPAGDGWTCSTKTSECSPTRAGCTGPCQRMAAVWCFLPGRAEGQYLPIDPPAPEVCFIAASACAARRTSADSACQEVNLTPDESRRALLEGLASNITFVTASAYGCFAFDDTRANTRTAVCYPTYRCESERADAERTLGSTGATANYSACEFTDSVWCFETVETDHCAPTREACEGLQHRIPRGAGDPPAPCREQR